MKKAPFLFVLFLLVAVVVVMGGMHLYRKHEAQTECKKRGQQYGIGKLMLLTEPADVEPCLEEWCREKASRNSKNIYLVQFAFSNGEIPERVYIDRDYKELTKSLVVGTTYQFCRYSAASPIHEHQDIDIISFETIQPYYGGILWQR